jgi:hypothetical protein
MILYSHYYGFSQSNLPDWISARPSPANVGYVSNVVIPVSWPISFGGGILLEFVSNNGNNDMIDNIIIEVYDNQSPRILRNKWSSSGTYGSLPTAIGGVFVNDSLVFIAISQIGNNDCATTSGKDELYVDDGTNVFSGIKCVGTNSAMPITYSKPLEATQKQNVTNLS